MINGLTAENLLLALPEMLRQDKQMQALAAGISEVLAARRHEIDQLLLYPRIDELPEALLDRLAYDFKVDWWDAEYSLAEKRQTLKDNWQVHRRLGTKAAVERAIAAIYPETKVLEWFEYGGEPYCFRVEINLSLVRDAEEKRRRVFERLECYKNLRSHLDVIDYFLESPTKQFSVRGGGAVCSGLISTELLQLAWQQSFGANVSVGAVSVSITQTELLPLAWQQDFAAGINVAAESRNMLLSSLRPLENERVK